MSLGLSHSLSRYKLKFSPEKVIHPAPAPGPVRHTWWARKQLDAPTCMRASHAKPVSGRASVAAAAHEQTLGGVLNLHCCRPVQQSLWRRGAAQRGQPLTWHRDHAGFWAGLL